MPRPDPRSLLIFPCNGNGLEALDCLGTQFACRGFVDDTPEKQAVGRAGHRVFDRGALSEFADDEVLAVPGSSASFVSRRALIEGLGVPRERFARVIHPGAHVSPQAQVGTNVLIMAGVVVTSNARIGDHVCVLPNTVIHHDVVIDDWTLIGASVTIAGGVHIGPNAYVGSGTRIINDVEIGARALIGLGSNVIRPVDADSVVAGNPARRLHVEQDRAGAAG